jgi:hypothetical protein
MKKNLKFGRNAFASDHFNPLSHIMCGQRVVRGDISVAAARAACCPAVRRERGGGDGGQCMRQLQVTKTRQPFIPFTPCGCGPAMTAHGFLGPCKEEISILILIHALWSSYDRTWFSGPCKEEISILILFTPSPLAKTSPNLIHTQSGHTFV